MGATCISYALLVFFCFIISCLHAFIQSTPLVTQKCVGRTKFAMMSTLPGPRNEAVNKLLDAIDDEVQDGYYTRTKEGKERIKSLVSELERFQLDPTEHVKWPEDLTELNGRWRLLFTSNLLGLAKLTSPLQLNEVFQVIDTGDQTLTNVVYGTVKPPLFAQAVDMLPLPEVLKKTADSVNEKLSFKVDFALEHSYTITSNEFPAQLKIVIEKVKLINAEKNARSLILPTLKPLAELGAGSFDTTYMKDGVRISRGKFDEVRVFTKEPEPNASYTQTAAEAANITGDVIEDFETPSDVE